MYTITGFFLPPSLHFPIRVYLLLSPPSFVPTLCERIFWVQSGIDLSLSARSGQHWNFLRNNCSKTPGTCNLSHDPAPERTPLCVHFLNKGWCTRERCAFPHVNVGQTHSVCRDFAVLGHCERGLECDHQHVRECPDAEKGSCEIRGCKLPHVIGENRSRKVADNQEEDEDDEGDDMSTSIVID